MNRKIIGIGLLTAVVIVLAIPASVKAVSFGANDSALVTQGTNIDMDFFMLTQFYGEKNETLNYNSTSTPNGWSGKLTGTYKGKQVNVNYLGDTSQFPLGPVTWTSSGFYGSDAWTGSGSALITGTGGNFQVDFQSSLNVGSHTGSSKFLINGTENASEIKYVDSAGMILIDGVSLPIPGGTISLGKKGNTWTNDVHILIVNIDSKCTFSGDSDFDCTISFFRKTPAVPAISVAGIVVLIGMLTITAMLVLRKKAK
jgi:hypothetical protein